MLAHAGLVRCYPVLAHAGLVKCFPILAHAELVRCFPILAYAGLVRCFPILAHAGLGVSIIHRILTWTTRSLRVNTMDKYNAHIKVPNPTLKHCNNNNGNCV